MKVIILAGGKGTRLAESARDIPKALVTVHGKTILEHQVDGLRKAGLSDIRFALGFRADQIISFLKERGLPYEYVVESEPLGTGGALRFASQDLREPFMMLNGDTISDFDYRKIIEAHEPGTALMAAYWKEDNRDYGLLNIANGRVREFLEKPRVATSGFINAGCTIIEPEHIRSVAKPSFMLELDIYPKLARAGRLMAFTHEGFFEDLGTEERLAGIRNAASLPI